MSEQVIIKLLELLGTALVTVGPILIAIINNRKKTQESLTSELDAMKRHREEQDRVLKESIETLKTEVSSVKDDVGALDNRLTLHIRENEDSTAEQIRVRILRADDELCDPNRPWPSWGSFEQMLIDCNTYTNYCLQHDDFQNSIANDAIESIRTKHRYCKDNCLYGKSKGLTNVE